MKYLKNILFAALCFSTIFVYGQSQSNSKFIAVKGKNLIAPNGQIFQIKGTNLGNWLNPEGYMFLFDKVNSFRLIDQLFKELVGDDFTHQFWQQFQDNYITQADIKYLKKIGVNTLRLPFHYKLFTHQDYMGQNNPNRGFELLDKAISWCKQEGIYVILDMHDAPGGQTGDNIDDSYGYPWLFENQNNQKLCCEIWQKIAQHYAQETFVLGYDLLNEPIAHYFENKDTLNLLLQPVYQKIVAAIRKVDTNHIVMLGGAQWNSKFKIFNDWKFDSKMMYTCHRYKCDTFQSNIKDFLDFRDKVDLPLYMGETGEASDDWIAGMRRVMDKCNMGWTFWTYKKMKKSIPESTYRDSMGKKDRHHIATILSIVAPSYWDSIIAYSKKDRHTFELIRKHRLPQDSVRKALTQLLENMQFQKGIKNKGYIDALGMKYE